MLQYSQTPYSRLVSRSKRPSFAEYRDLSGLGWFDHTKQEKREQTKPYSSDGFKRRKPQFSRSKYFLGAESTNCVLKCLLEGLPKARKQPENTGAGKTSSILTSWIVTNPGTTPIAILVVNSDHGLSFAGEETRTMVWVSFPLQIYSTFCHMHTALHIASASLFVTCIAPPHGLKPQPENGVCLALLVHAGIIVLRFPALLSNNRSGHCVIVGKITCLLRHNRLWAYQEGTLFGWIQREMWQIKIRHPDLWCNLFSRPSLRWMDHSLSSGFQYKQETWSVISNIMLECWWSRLVLPCLSRTVLMKFPALNSSCAISNTLTRSYRLCYGTRLWRLRHSRVSGRWQVKGHMPL